eukprot:CAMPEP_0116013602 /NCGR_PEP_ID=MMETSP0321-20121206/5818_1 /TAXON_ID=163516 /ORGANISM="Leptocylindrus danicus var. danicus, Strain B650" /LENGTH=261 /DNA_ID=CAMNT_0003483171 /DNA_START=75 /DNA_END=860 /DNA_ORIENTATION=+
MVRSSNFSMELVRADDKTQKFPEHIGPILDPVHYFEVEPDVEYFIKIRADTSFESYVTLSVDGEDLGYFVILSAATRQDCSSQYNGIFELSGGIETMKALRFQRTKVSGSVAKGKSGVNNRPAMWTGQIKATFYEAIPLGLSARDMEFKSQWNPLGKVGATIGVDSLAQKKGVMSSKGKSMVVERRINEGDMVQKYMKGRMLCDISAKYCCTPGLIANGILRRYTGPRDDYTHVSIDEDEVRVKRRKKEQVPRDCIDLTEE